MYILINLNDNLNNGYKLRVIKRIIGYIFGLEIEGWEYLRNCISEFWWKNK